MTVSELIEHLKTFNPSLPVCYRCMSDQVLLEKDSLSVVRLCAARPDGWIECARPDKESFEYLMFPGN